LIVDPTELDRAAARIAGLMAKPGAIEGIAARAAATWTESDLYRDSFREAALDLAAKPLTQPSTAPSAPRNADR
jgi:hypothetical protein